MNDKHYPYFGAPSPRQPRPAAEEPALRGKRAILSTPEGFVYDMRAVSGICIDSRGNATVNISTEEDYYRWMLLGTPPAVTSYPTHLVWIE